MNYNDFEKLYRNDPLVFHLAMELFMENGRDLIETLSDQELGAEAARQASSFFSDGKIDETVKAVKDFAALRTIDLLAYAGRCGIKLEESSTDEPGICPLCGGRLEFQETEPRHYYILNWRCAGCGATGKEGYRKVFDCHYNVRDGEGHLVDRRNPKE